MKHKRNLSLLAALAVVGSLAFSGCATNADTPTGSKPDSGSQSNAAPTTLPKKDTYVIGYSQANNAEPYRAQLNAQLEYYASQEKNIKLLPIADAQQD